MTNHTPDQNDDRRQTYAEQKVAAELAAVVAAAVPLGDWSRRAACASKDVDPEMFDVPSSGTDAKRVLADQRRAANVCASCPVREACLAEGRKRKAEGVWGGVLRITNGLEYDLVALHAAGDLTHARGRAGRPRTTAA